MDKHLFISCFLLVALNLVIAVAMFLRRVGDIKSGATDIKFFKTYDLNTTIPRVSRQLTRNFINQFETPVLFYVAIGFILIFKVNDSAFVSLAYLFSGLRILHSLIHTSSNRIYPRMISFFSAYLVIMIIWVRLLLAL